MGFNILNKIRNLITIDSANEVFVGKNLKISSSKVLLRGHGNKLIIKDNIKIRDSFIQIIGTNCQVIIENGVIVGRDSYISSREEETILYLGENAGFSRNTKVMTSDGCPIFKDRKNITIKKNVWIADDVSISKSVTIDESFVIGINSTVVKDIPRICVASGTPCMKKGITWES